MQRHALFAAPSILFVFVACSSATATDSADAGASSSGDTSASCGAITPSSTACGQCLHTKCCAQGRACEPDQTCASCVAGGADSVGDSACQSNALYTDVFDCVNGPCADVCSGSSGGGAGSGSASCRSVTCTEGAAGDKLCRDQGCGPCSFGGCNGF